MIPFNIGCSYITINFSAYATGYYDRTGGGGYDSYVRVSNTYSLKIDVKNNSYRWIKNSSNLCDHLDTGKTDEGHKYIWADISSLTITSIIFE